MKFKLYFLSAFVILFLFSSCAMLHESRNVTNGSRQTKPDFMEDVVIGSGANSVYTHKNKSIYCFKQGLKKLIADTAITIEDSVTTTDTALAGFIERWLGAPYKYGGDSKNGIDCSAFSQKLYAVVYHESLFRTAFQQFNASIPIYDPDNLQEGDLVFFKIHSLVISHVGVYLSDGYFVQASSSGVMVSNLDDQYWKRYFYAGGRVKGS